MCEYLTSARPTAVNLAWTLRQATTHVAPFLPAGTAALLAALLSFSQHAQTQDVASTGLSASTHCRYYKIAPRSSGTAMPAGWRRPAMARRFLLLREQNRRVPHVFVDETDPCCNDRA